MRVLVACGWPRPVGVAVHAGRLTAALRERGLVVRAVAVGAHGVADPDVVVLSGGTEDAVARLEAAVREPVDIGHAEDPCASAALIALREAGLVRRVVTTVHHLEAHSRVEPEEMERRAVQESDVVVCGSGWWAHRLRDEFGVEPVVVPHGVEADRFAGHGGDRVTAGEVMGWGSRCTVLTLGGVQKRKGSRVLLEAFARARARLGPDALLAVAGPVVRSDYWQAWCDDARRLGLTVAALGEDSAGADVVQLGVITAEAMPMLYRAVDVVATPSTREGFGLVVLEAAAAGVPNVVSDLPVFREHLTDGESCLMVPVGDSGPLATALVRAVHEPDLRGNLAAGGLRVARRLSWSVSAAAHEAVYRRALDETAS